MSARQFWQEKSTHVQGTEYNLDSVHPYLSKTHVSHKLLPSVPWHAIKKDFRKEIHSMFETHDEGKMKSKKGEMSGSTQ